MKGTTLALAVVMLLACACSSLQTSSRIAAQPRADLGVRSTKWGTLHEFAPVAPLPESRFVRTSSPNTPSGTALVELLISAEGKVLDAAVVESSGNPSVDEAAKAAFAGSVFPRIEGYTSSEPYIARHRVVFKESSGLAMKQWVDWPAAN